jgi:hypothetical protein
MDTGKCLKHFSVGVTGKETAVTSLSYDHVSREDTFYTFPVTLDKEEMILPDL